MAHSSRYHGCSCSQCSMFMFSVQSSSSVFNVHVEKRPVSGVDTSSLRHGVMTENMVIVCGTDNVMYRIQIVADQIVSGR